MSDSITIRVVRNGSSLRPATFQDRWNLESLGVDTDAMSYDRSQSFLKRLRRAHNPVGCVAFVFTMVKPECASADVSHAESMAFSAISLKHFPTDSDRRLFRAYLDRYHVPTDRPKHPAYFPDTCLYYHDSATLESIVGPTD